MKPEWIDQRNGVSHLMHVPQTRENDVLSLWGELRDFGTGDTFEKYGLEWEVVRRVIDLVDPDNGHIVLKRCGTICTVYADGRMVYQVGKQEA